MRSNETEVIAAETGSAVIGMREGPAEDRSPREYSEQYYNLRSSLMMSVELSHLIALAAPRPGKRIFEAGCGGGLFLARCGRREPRAILLGFDVNDTAARIARRNAPKAATCLADAAHLPLKKGVCDALVAQHLIEHFEDGNALLSEWRRVLSPAGRVVLATPNGLHGDSALFDDPGHRHVYTKESIEQLLRENGFVVDRCYTLMPYLGNRRLTWTLARWLLRPLLATRFLPYFRDRGLTLFVRARKREPYGAGRASV